MTLQLIYRWFSRLPPLERDLPLVVLDGRAYTPRAVLEEVRRGTALGERLQMAVESGALGASPREEEELAKLRLRAILSRYPPDAPIVATLGLPGRVYTARELMEEVEGGTGVGAQWVRAELERCRVLLRLR